MLIRKPPNFAKTFVSAAISFITAEFVLVKKIQYLYSSSTSCAAELAAEKPITLWKTLPTLYNSRAGRTLHFARTSKKFENRTCRPEPVTSCKQAQTQSIQFYGALNVSSAHRSHQTNKKSFFGENENRQIKPNPYTHWQNDDLERLKSFMVAQRQSCDNYVSPSLIQAIDFTADNRSKGDY